MDPAAKALLTALSNRNSYRKNPPHDIMNLQNVVRDVGNRMARSRDEVVRLAKIRSPQRRDVSRVVGQGVLELVDTVTGEVTYVVYRGPSSTSDSYDKFWDLGKNAPVYVRRRTMEVVGGDRNGHRVRVHEHWTASGIRR